MHNNFRYSKTNNKKTKQKEKLEKLHTENDLLNVEDKNNNHEK